jgi:hypothetical protein
MTRQDTFISFLHALYKYKILHHNMDSNLTAVLKYRTANFYCAHRFHCGKPDTNYWELPKLALQSAANCQNRIAVVLAKHDRFFGAATVKTRQLVLAARALVIRT